MTCTFLVGYIPDIWNYGLDDPMQSRAGFVTGANANSVYSWSGEWVWL